MPEYMAFGGIQDVGLKEYLSQVKRQNFDKLGNIYYDRTILEIKLEFTIKDWFGVDKRTKEKSRGLSN